MSIELGKLFDFPLWLFVLVKGLKVRVVLPFVLPTVVVLIGKHPPS